MGEGGREGGADSSHSNMDNEDTIAGQADAISTHSIKFNKQTRDTYVVMKTIKSQ